MLERGNIRTHAELLHHPSGAPVRNASERNYLGEPDPLETDQRRIDPSVNLAMGAATLSKEC